MERWADETGETLVELMLTIIIMAIGVTAVVAALYTTIVGSDAHHSMSQGEVMVRDYGEAIKEKAIEASAFTACPTKTELDPGAGFSPTVAGEGTVWNAQIDSVAYWVPGTTPSNDLTFTDWATCDAKYDDCYNAQFSGGFTPACDPGFQRVTYHVWNNRTDYGQFSIEGRVLTRRNNVSAVKP